MKGNRDSDESGVVLGFPKEGGRRKGDCPVKRLDVLSLYQLGGRLADAKPIVFADDSSGINIWIGLTNLEGALRAFVDDQAAFTLAVESARELVATIRIELTEFFNDPSDRQKFKEGLDLNAAVPTWHFWRTKSKISEFEHVFSAVCKNSETYFIEQKLGFDTGLLLHEADANIHQSVRPFVAKECIDEIREAGRCFALESYTACGFHTLRALEVVMSDYYKKVSGKDKTFRSWHDYIEEFTKLEKSTTRRGSKYPSPKVAAMLDRMRQLDRNPLMHPRDSLDEMAADTLFKLGIVTISELAKDMREMSEEPELKLVSDNAEAGQTG